MKCAMLVANQFADEEWVDPRVDKEARALMAAGHDLVVLATARFGRPLPSREVRQGLLVMRKPTLLHRLFALIRRRPAGGGQQAGGRQVYYESSRSGGGLRRRAMQAAADLQNVLFCLAVLPEAVRQRADVYVGHDLNGLVPAFLAAKLTRARLVYNSHELWTERARLAPYPCWQKTLVSWVERSLCRRCGLVIAVSESSARVLAERYRIPLPMVVPNVHSYAPVIRTEQIRARLTDSPDKKVAIFVGKIDPTRGIEEIVEAAPRLNDNVVIAILGDGSRRAAIEQQIRDRQLDGRVRLLGWIPSKDILSYVACADVGISPSAPQSRSCLNNYYSLDNKSFHYLMCGIPLIGNDQPEKRRLIERYGVGAVYDENDPADLARTINRVLGDSLEYEAMCHRAREASRTDLNWDVVSRRYVETLERLAVGAQLDGESS